MRRVEHGLAAGAVLGLVLVLSPWPAEAFCLHTYTGYKAHAKWKNLPVSYKVSANATAEVVAAIDKAFQTWSQVDCSNLAFRNDGTFAPAQTDFQTHAYKGIYVFWYDDASGFPIDPQFYAYSFSGHDNDGGIAFASVAINGFNFKWNTAGGDAQQQILDVQNELVYLIGTVIGLANSTASDSVMVAGGQYGSTGRHTLRQDDKDAVVYQYPKDATCVAPAPAADCAGPKPPSDGSVPTGDGGVPTGDGGGQPVSDGGVIPGSDGSTNGGDGGGSGDGGTATGDDGGCGCTTTGPARGLTALVFLTLLAIGLLGWRRRRSR